jgi:hypothetical protein
LHVVQPYLPRPSSIVHICDRFSKTKLSTCNLGIIHIPTTSTTDCSPLTIVVDLYNTVNTLTCCFMHSSYYFISDCILVVNCFVYPAPCLIFFTKPSQYRARQDILYVFGLSITANCNFSYNTPQKHL